MCFLCSSLLTDFDECYQQKDQSFNKILDLLTNSFWSEINRMCFHISMLCHSLENQHIMTCISCTPRENKSMFGLLKKQAFTSV